MLREEATHDPVGVESLRGPDHLLVINGLAENVGDDNADARACPVARIRTSCPRPVDRILSP
jgi:hypothetical protein